MQYSYSIYMVIFFSINLVKFSKSVLTFIFKCLEKTPINFETPLMPLYSFNKASKRDERYTPRSATPVTGE